MVVGLIKLKSKFIHFIQSLGPGGLAWPFDILSQAKNVGLAMALAWLGWAFLCQAWLGLGLEARPSTSLVLLCRRLVLALDKNDNACADLISLPLQSSNAMGFALEATTMVVNK